MNEIIVKEMLKAERRLGIFIGVGISILIFGIVTITFLIL